MAAGLKQSGGAFPALTSIRFIAAFTVVISHFCERRLLPLPAWLFDFIDGGRSAVSLFFVLSGFILTFTYRDKMAHGGVRAFYEARVARIYPMILFGLLMCVPVVIYLVHSDDPSLMQHWYALKGPVYPLLAISLLGQLLLLNGWFPFAAMSQPWNGPSESVSCEAFFYLLFPFLLRRMTALSLARIGLFALFAWLATGLWIALLQTFLPLSRSAAMIYSMPLTRLAEFVMGIAVALYYLRVRASGRSQHAKGVALCGTALFAIVVLSAWRPLWPAWYLEAPFYAALILGLALLERPVLGVLSWRPLVHLGEASYSLYLTHLPVALWALMLGFGPSNGWLMIPVSVLIGLLCFRFYEEPMRRRIRARFAISKCAQPAVAEAESSAI